MNNEYIYEKDSKKRILEVFDAWEAFVCVADEEERIVGVIGKKEAAYLRGYEGEITAGELCNRNFKYARKEYEKEDIRKIFEETLLWSIPVLDENRHLIGRHCRTYFILDKFAREKAEEYKGDNFISYAQWEEDVILDWILKDVSKIFYIDGGANCPTLHSVTKNAYDNRGARGINIDPVQYYYQELVMDRPEDITLKCCIGAKQGEIDFWYDGGVSTGIEAKKTDRSVKMKMPVRTLNSICEEYIDKNQEIHFMKLDIEGMEYEALQGMSFSTYRPWVLCIERNRNEEIIKEYLHEKGYRFMGQYDVNHWYLAEEHAKLADRFIDKEKIKENYTIILMPWYETGLFPEGSLS